MTNLSLAMTLLTAACSAQQTQPPRMVRIPCEPIAACERQYIGMHGYNPKACTVEKRVGELWRRQGNPCGIVSVSLDPLP